MPGKAQGSVSDPQCGQRRERLSHTFLCSRPLAIPITQPLELPTESSLTQNRRITKLEEL